MPPIIAAPYQVASPAYIQVVAVEMRSKGVHRLKLLLNAIAHFDPRERGAVLSLSGF